MISYGLDLGGLIQQDIWLFWHVHTYNNALFWSTYPMCTLINALGCYLHDLGDPGLTKCVNGVFGLFWLSYEHLLPP